MPIGQAPVVEHLQEHVEDFRMGFFDLVEQQHRIRPPPNRLGQITPLFIADITGRRSDQSGDGVLFHEFRHVDADHGRLGIEQKLGQGLAKLGLADAGGAEEQEGAVRAIRVRQARARPAYGVGDRGYRLVLTHDPPAQCAFHAQQALAVALKHLADGNAGGAGENIGDFLIGNPIAHEFPVRNRGRGGLFQFLLQRRDDAILDFGHAREIAGALGGFEVDPGLFQARLDRLGAMQGSFLGLPDLVEIGVFPFQAADFPVEFLHAFLRCRVLVLLERLPLDLQLDQPPVEHVHLFGLGVDFHADHAGGLVHEIDRLVRKLAVRNIALGQARGGDDGRIRNFHAMMDLVALL